MARAISVIIESAFGATMVAPRILLLGSARSLTKPVAMPILEAVISESGIRVFFDLIFFAMRSVSF